LESPGRLDRRQFRPGAGAKIQAGRTNVWLSGEIKTPPFSATARIEAGMLLRRLQKGESITLPHSRPMPSIGKACHELRMRSSQSRVAKIETGDPSVSLDLIVRAFLATGATRRELQQAFA
jgi:hypothetical protein